MQGLCNIPVNLSAIEYFYSFEKREFCGSKSSTVTSSACQNNVGLLIHFVELCIEFPEAWELMFFKIRPVLFVGFTLPWKLHTVETLC